MPQFIPLLAASEPVCGTLTGWTRRLYASRASKLQGENSNREFKAVARAGSPNPSKWGAQRRFRVQLVLVEANWREVLVFGSGMGERVSFTQRPNFVDFMTPNGHLAD